MADRTAGRLVVAFTALAALLCCLGLGRPSLWIDEAHSFEFSALPSVPLVVLNAAARDAYPPFYFILLHGWMQVAGTEVWMRMFSVLCHLASIPLVFVVGRQLLSLEAGVAAAGLLALNPFHLAFAREVRMYSLLELLALVSLWGLTAWLRDGSRRGRQVWVAATVALAYTHFMAVLVPAAQALFVVAGGWGGPNARVRAHGFARRAAVAALCFLPWAPLFLKAVVTTGGYGAEAPAGDLARNFLGTLGAGFGQAPWLIALAAAGTALVALSGALALPAGPVRRIVLLSALLPPVVELAAGAMGKPVFGERTLITATPAWLLLAAAALVRAPRWQAGCAATLTGVLSGLGIAHVLVWSLGSAPAHREALATILAQARTGDAIVHSATTTYHAVHEYYLPRSRAVVPDFLLEPQGEFRGGRLGIWFRDRWRAARARLDPAGVLHTGVDPNRIAERVFLGRGYRRVWYLHTDREGARRQWLLIPAVFGDPRPEKVREIPWVCHELVARRYRPAGTPVRWPGLVVEEYVRR